MSAVSINYKCLGLISEHSVSALMNTVDGNVSKGASYQQFETQLF